MVERKVAVLRADASDLIGVGHVMRSLALGEALLDADFDVVLATVDLPAGMREEAHKCGITVVDLRCVPFGSDDALATLLLNGAVLVIDGYKFEREFFEILENGTSNFVVIDDNVETKSLAPSVVINQNPHATAVPVTAMRPRSLRSKSTIMTFSARFLGSELNAVVELSSALAVPFMGIAAIC
jgi:UDP-2,4-diacetamido-2,4,6-trideoxy-beta-L-altropyranose hydrolase